MAEGYIFDEALGLCTKYMESLGATQVEYKMQRKEWLGRSFKGNLNHSHY